MSEDLITDEMVEAGARAICAYQSRPCPGKACASCANKARHVIEAALRARAATAAKTEA